MVSDIQPFRNKIAKSNDEKEKRRNASDKIGMFLMSAMEALEACQ